MISIQTGMLVALGSLIASLVWLLLASAFWSRAVRLTTERLKRSMPISEAEIQADRDRLRTEHAIKVHSLEKRLDQAKLDRARHIIEINRRDARISVLENEIVAIRSELDEHQNARRVLEQTVADRLPKVEARLTEAKRLLFNRDREIAELAQSAKRHKLALDEASSINAQKEAEIERLNSAIVARGGRSRRAGSEQRAESDMALRAELEALRAKTRDQASLIDRLQRRHIQDPASTALPKGEERSGGDLLKETLAEAEAGLRAVREPAPTASHVSAKDQAARISRAEPADAKSERQAETISKLRAELAAAHERLSRQAAHFVDELHRAGGARSNGLTQAATSQPPARNGEARKLVERVAQVRPSLADKPRVLATVSSVPDVVNGKDHKSEANPASASESAPEPELEVASAAPPPAAEMPQTAAIPGERRKLRLLDRITSLSKG